MRIAVISMIRENWGGSEELWAAMAERALEEGHQVFHYTFDFNEFSEKEKVLASKGLRIVTRKGYFKKGMNPLVKKMKIAANFLFNKLRPPFSDLFKQKPDYILYNGTCYSITQEKHLLPQLLSSDIPFGILGHFAEKPLLEQNEAETLKQVYNKARHLFFISKRAIDTINQQLNIPLPEAILVRNPVNMSSTDIVPYPSNPVVQMATVGNLVMAHKGQHLLLEVLSGAEWKKRNWKLNIFGVGSDESTLKEMVSKYGLSDKVIFHGKTDNIRKLWAENHLLIMPSLMEGMPLAVVEAMLCGRPSVVTNVGDHAEWIRDGLDGFIADKASVSSISDAMEKAWSVKEKWQEMGISAHENAMRLYDLQPGKTLLNYIK